jgi:N6-L-threonylcarbamoyladenine synthase
VASNSGLRNTMNDKCQKAGIRLMMPPPVLCTDNAAMIGSAAFYRLMRGEIAGLDLNATPSLRLV